MNRLNSGIIFNVFLKKIFNLFFNLKYFKNDYNKIL